MALALQSIYTATRVVVATDGMQREAIESDRNTGTLHPIFIAIDEDLKRTSGTRRPIAASRGCEAVWLPVFGHCCWLRVAVVACCGDVIMVDNGIGSYLLVLGCIGHVVF